jgi:hypothetical protein
VNGYVVWVVGLLIWTGIALWVGVGLGRHLRARDEPYDQRDGDDEVAQ